MLDTLISVVRSRPTQRRLVCPRCGNDVELREPGWLYCAGQFCGHLMKTLAELVVTTRTTPLEDKR